MVSARDVFNLFLGADPAYYDDHDFDLQQGLWASAAAENTAEELDFSSTDDITDQMPKTSSASGNVYDFTHPLKTEATTSSSNANASSQPQMSQKDKGVIGANYNPQYSQWNANDVAGVDLDPNLNDDKSDPKSDKKWGLKDNKQTGSGVSEKDIQTVRKEEGYKADQRWARKLEDAKINYERDLRSIQSTLAVALKNSQNDSIRRDHLWRRQFEEMAMAHTRDLQELTNQTAQQIRDLQEALASSQEDFASLRNQVRLDESLEPSEVKTQFARVRSLMETLCHDVSELWTEKNPDRAEATTSSLSNTEVLKAIEAGPPLSLLTKGRELSDVLDCGLLVIANTFLHRIIYMPFHPTLGQPDSDLLNKMYDKVRRAEPQIASGKWRSQLYSAIEVSTPKHTHQEILQTVVRKIEKSWSDMMAFTNGGASTSISSAHQKRLRDVVTAAWDWNRLIKSQVLTLDFHPAMANHDTKFDEAAMDLPKRTNKPDRIHCTLLPGLQTSEAGGGGQIPAYRWLEKIEVDF